MCYNLLKYYCNIFKLICHPFNLFIMNFSYKLASFECTYPNLVTDRCFMHFRKIKGHEGSDNYSEIGSKISPMASYS